MSYWRSEYDDGWWTFYKDGIEIKLDNLNFGDLIVDEINNANQRIAELEEKLTIKTLENLKGASVLTDLKARIAELESKMPCWIPVSERLPEKAGTYLVYYKNYLDTANFDVVNTKWQICYTNWIKDIDYWMPLPQLPEVSNE